MSGIGAVGERRLTGVLVAPKKISGMPGMPGRDH